MRQELSTATQVHEEAPRKMSWSGVRGKILACWRLLGAAKIYQPLIPNANNWRCRPRCNPQCPRGKPIRTHIQSM